MLIIWWEKSVSVRWLQYKPHFQTVDTSHLLLGRSARSMLEKVVASEFNEEIITSSQGQIKQENVRVQNFNLVSSAVAGSGKMQ